MTCIVGEWGSEAETDFFQLLNLDRQDLSSKHQ